MTADRRGQRPEAQRDQRQDGPQPSDLCLHRLERRPRGQHAGRAVAAGRSPSSSRSGGPGRCSSPSASCGPRRRTSAAGPPREHPPSQAVGPLDRRRDVHRERAEVAAVEDHRPPGARRSLDPPPRLVVDGPGHAAARAVGAIREAVERRLQLLVQGEPQAQPGEDIEARGEPAEGQGQGHEEGDRDARDQAHGPSSAAGGGGSPSR